MPRAKIVAYQDESGDLYCPEHAHEGDRPYGLADLLTWTHAAALHCDFCGVSVTNLVTNGGDDAR